MRKFDAIVFDIDGTLTPQVSWYSLTVELGASVERHAQIFHDYEAGKTTYDKSKSQLLQLWRDTGRAKRQNLEEVFTRLPMSDESQPLVAWLRHQGYALCLISGSMDLYVKATSTRLGIEDWFANTTLIFDDIGNLVDFDYDLDQAGKKLRQFKDFCSQRCLDPTRVAVVGDSENDIALFAYTGNGILVSQDETLSEHSWKRVDDLKEIRSLLHD